METTNTFYPVFEPDQVLTSEHLNQLRRFLTEQDRITRRQLIGIGIVCGLEISNPTSGSILISKGVGVTSKGFMISLAESLCRYYRVYTDKTFTESSCTSLTEGKYTPFLDDDGKQYNLWELLTAEEEAEIDDPTITALSNDPDSLNLDEMYVLLYLEIEDKNLMSCVESDCDEKGIKRNFRVRKLMIRKADLIEIINKAGGYDDLSQEELEEEINAKYYLKEVSLKRLGYNYSSSAKTLSFEGYHYFSILYSNYRSIILESIPEISSALYQSYQAYKPVLANDYSTTPFNNYDKTNVAQLPLYSKIYNYIQNNKYAVQYVYDFLDDLVEAYNEFREVAFQVMVACCPDANTFPRHLMLGKAFDAIDEHTIFRHYFLYSPILADQKRQAEKARILFLKIVKMINGFYEDLLKLDEIKITPSRPYSSPLSQRAIPFYYSVNDQSKLFKYWNYELKSKYCSRLNLSYHAKNYNTRLDEKFVWEPNWWDYKQYDLLRIEGHVGKKYETAVANIIGQTEQLNLPVKVIGLKLSKRFDNTTISIECKFEDLENLFDTYRSSMQCNLLEEAEFFRSLKTDVQNDDKLTRVTDTIGATGKSMVNVSELISKLYGSSASDKFTKSTTKSYEITDNSIYNVINDNYKESKEGTIGFLLDSSKEDTSTKVVDMLLNAFAKGELGSISSNIFTHVILYPVQIATKIEALSKAVSDNLEDLEIENVQDAYDSLKETSESFKDAITANLENPDYQRIGNEEIILYRLDKLIYLCCISKIKELYQIYLERIAEVKKMNLFANFAAKHPGMEHIGGVCKGGTFIVVYIDKNELVATKPGLTDTITDVVTDRVFGNDYLNFMSASSGIKEASGTTISDKLKDISYRNLVVSEKISKVLETTNDSGKIQKNISDILKNELAVDIPSISDLLANIDVSGIVQPDIGSIATADSPPDNVVVADFALPYICCSECPQVATMIVAQISISLPKTEFCGNDDTNYPFTLNPQGGTVTGPGVTSSGSDYYFNPSKVETGIEDVQFTYVVNNQTVVYNVKVYKPVAKFEVLDIVVLNDGSVQVQFVNQSTGASKYLWDFGDGTTSMQTDPIHTYKNYEGSVAVVTLTAMRGECESLMAIDVEIPQPIEIQFDIEPKVFCKKDTSLTPFIISPEGGKVTGYGVVEQDGKFYFKPSDENVKEGTVDFVFTAPNGQQATLQVTVYNPVALFEYKVGEYDPDLKGVKVEFFNKSTGADSFTWDFGDGKTSDEESPVHEYVDVVEPVVKVLLLANRDICTDSFEAEIELPQGIEYIFDLSKRQFCNNDKQLYKFTTQPPADEEDPVTGEGVVVYNNVYYFRPLKLNAGAYILKYRDMTLDVEVFQAPIADFNFEVSNTAFGALVYFYYPYDNIKSILWDFADGQTSIELNPQHIYRVETKTTFSVKIEVTGPNGCISTTIKEVVVEPLVNIPSINVTDVISRLESNKLSTVIFGDNNRLSTATTSYFNSVNEEMTNPDTRTTYLSGAKNDEIATNSAKLINSTFNTISGITGRDKKLKQNYLMEYLRVQLESLINLTKMQEGDIKSRSKIQKLYLQIAEKLDTLKSQNVNVDPENMISNLIEKNIEETVNKPVLNKALTNILEVVK